MSIAAATMTARDAPEGCAYTHATSAAAAIASLGIGCRRVQRVGDVEEQRPAIAGEIGPPRRDRMPVEGEASLVDRHDHRHRVERAEIEGAGAGEHHAHRDRNPSTLDRSQDWLLAHARVLVDFPKRSVPGAGIEPTRPSRDPGF